MNMFELNWIPRHSTSEVLGGHLDCIVHHYNLGKKWSMKDFSWNVIYFNMLGMLGIVKGPYFFQRTLDDWATKQIRDIQAALCRGVMEHNTKHSQVYIIFQTRCRLYPTHPDTKFSSKHKILFSLVFSYVFYHVYWKSTHPVYVIGRVKQFCA